MRQGIPQPTPTDLELAQATLPMRINLPTQPQGDDGRTGANQIKRSGGQNQTQMRQRRTVSQLARLQLETSRLVVEKIFFNGLTLLRNVELLAGLGEVDTSKYNECPRGYYVYPIEKVQMSYG